MSQRFGESTLTTEFYVFSFEKSKDFFMCFSNCGNKKGEVCGILETTVTHY